MILELVIIESDTGKHFSIFPESRQSSPLGHISAGMIQSCFSLILLDFQLENTFFCFPSELGYMLYEIKLVPESIYSPKN